MGKTTRDIARTAVRAQLAPIAVELFLREGFDNVTVTELAEATGVSRSTFLRYFGNKEEAVLTLLDNQGEQVAQALRSRPADESDWAALRRAVDVLFEPYHDDPVEALALTRLVMDTPALRSKRSERFHGWRPLLAEAMATRTGAGPDVPMGLSVKAAAALDCMEIAIERWTASDGELDLVALLDEAFAALDPR
ncbi:TetR/AcrR family transcriptional regulator [Solirubrobacter phytolaccae]|uniref:TetR/AcrR family transcriptional regulator n=1 Tax=Solirubrobacter phytolaccae TaxID=1404360 RepID=A0A9X3NCP6_9ACTN|nr:TetR family transcriptional regulator [Solirubrobacter phytolaccae]MDA0184033.1 TetR/AcrR family transcriptional regulator [Solirubrobacter phytolaccae]